MFTTYGDKCLKTVLPINAKVVICDVWAYDGDNMPSKMFDVSVIAEEGDTVQDTLEYLGQVYDRLCKEANLTPREAYGYEGCVQVTDELFKIMLGT